MNAYTNCNKLDFIGKMWLSVSCWVSNKYTDAAIFDYATSGLGQIPKHIEKTNISNPNI